MGLFGALRELLRRKKEVAVQAAPVAFVALSPVEELLEARKARKAAAAAQQESNE